MVCNRTVFKNDPEMSVDRKCHSQTIVEHWDYITPVLKSAVPIGILSVSQDLHVAGRGLTS